jgi:hypothetical protein
VVNASDVIIEIMKKVLPIGIALIICAVFLLLVISPGGCAFNFIPYLIHEGMSKGGAGESEFIKGFDIVVGVAISLIVYKIVKMMLVKGPK